MPTPVAPIQLIIRLPYNRPPADETAPEPPLVVWNAEKESILWELIARQRMSENSATDWQGLSQHLGVPLPFLLYRAQARYEQDLRGLQNVGGVLSGTPQTPLRALPGEDERVRPRLSTAATGSSRPPPHLSPTLRRSGGSSSTFTLKQGRALQPISPLPEQPSVNGSDDQDDEEDSDHERAEEEEQRREESENVARKLKQLERMFTADNLGFARRNRATSPSVAPAPASPSRQTDPTSGSAASSLRGSIPSIPSPPSASLSGRSKSITTTSPRTASVSSSSRGNVRMNTAPVTRYAAIERTLAARGSNQGSSSASSFSDVDIDDASLTQSVLAEALESNMRFGGSRLSAFTRSHFSGRTTGS